MEPYTESALPSDMSMHSGSQTLISAAPRPADASKPEPEPASETSAASTQVAATRFLSLEPDHSPARPLQLLFSRHLPPPSSSKEGGGEEISGDGPNDQISAQPYPGSGTKEDPYLVDWLPGEGANPYNWSVGYRTLVTGLLCFTILNVTYGSSAYTPTLGELEARFHMSSEVGALGLSLYVLGFGVGPLFWAPVSEIYGRNVAFYASFPFFVVFTLMTALSKNIPTLIISRLLVGIFGSAPITNAGAQIADMFTAQQRLLASSLFVSTPFMGPVLGPIFGGYITEYAGFRWVFWMHFIWAGVTLVGAMLVCPETYAPTLLREKAARLQKEADRIGTGEHFVSRFDVHRKSAVEVFGINLSRPFQLLAREVIVICLSLYGALNYATLYLFFQAFPIVFRKYRHWGLGLSGLPFIGIGLGLGVATAMTPIWSAAYRKAYAEGKRRGEKGAPPEARILSACLGAIFLPVGLFWFAWTSRPNIHWIVPILASVPFGAGFLLVFNGITLYVIDAYELYAASGLAAAAVVRSVMAAAFPLFGTQMYDRLGLEWAGTLVAFLSLACTPMPFLIYKYGPALRRHSRYAPSGPSKTQSNKQPQPNENDALEPEFGPHAGEQLPSVIIGPSKGTTQ